MIEPLRLSYEVDCSPAHAFATWTEKIGTWWPRDHTASGDPDAEVVLEPGVGGRIFERTPDGTEIPWGELTRWDPPQRLAYLWHLAHDRSDATDVDITFVELDGGRTRVDIVHTGWERLGANGQALRDANTSGWNAVVPRFVTACADVETS
jgi:uncharacterized protein YndB with AHSA1/START domain